jgi:multicomponent Na+:H+ antiporter subunit E
MNGFWWNCALAVAWALITGDLSITNVVIGFLIGTGILMLVGRAVGSPGYVRTVWAFIVLAVVFLRDLTIANFAVAHDLLTPKSQLRPGIIKVPLTATTDAEITALANLLTLTPGTTTIDISEDRSTLYLHVMYLDREGPDRTREKIQREIEARLLRVTR